MEIWKYIKFIDLDGKHYDYTNIYEISNFGRIRKGNRILKYKDNHGYDRVGLTDVNHERKFFQVHRLVAFMFLDYPNNIKNPQINHKDENKKNNSVDNLEWVSAKENCNYGTRNKRMGKKLQGRKDQSKPVIGINVKTGEKVEFASANIANNKYNGVKNVLCGRAKTAHGYKWFYKD